MGMQAAMQMIKENMVNKLVFDKDGLYITLAGKDYEFNITASTEYENSIYKMYAAFLCNGNYGFRDYYNSSVNLFPLTMNELYAKDDYSSDLDYESKKDRDSVYNTFKKAIDMSTGYEFKWTDTDIKLLNHICDNFELCIFICKDMVRLDRVIKVEGGKATLIMGDTYK